MGLKPISLLHLRPSFDLGKLAAQVYSPKEIKCSRSVKWFLDRLYHQSEESGESDLLSHLLFDRCYTAEAERLGFKDAQNQEEELLQFFSL